MTAANQLVATLSAAKTDLTAKELCAVLGVSQPTFSRMVAAAGVVISYGAKADTRYTLLAQETPYPLYRVGGEGQVSALGSLYAVQRGRFVFAPVEGTRVLFESLPWFLYDLRPQGFLGRRFPQQHPDLNLPASILEWNDHQILTALSQRGDDLPGNLIVGEASLARYLRLKPKVVTPRTDYPRLAMNALEGDVNTSSAGGEQPKFTCFDGQRHLIVKFSPPVDLSPAARRWADLLVCEDIANKILGHHGLQTARTEIFLEQGRVFLESVRFDRTPKGRGGLVSMAGVDAEFVGQGYGWTRTAAALRQQKRLDPMVVGDIQCLELFGKFIGNTDMHQGNLSCFTENFQHFRLAPIYDMVPMLFSPSSQGEVAVKALDPPMPTPENVRTWEKARAMAGGFWQAAAEHPLISADFRPVAQECAGILGQVRQAATLLQPTSRVPGRSPSLGY